MDRDDFNLHLVTSSEAVDQINQNFYERFQYPPPPLMLTELVDPHFEIRMLNQSVGSWDHQRLPRDPKIWIAGCGRNQAFITALRFPHARIVATDLSAKSLASAKAMAASLGVRNIDFRQQSINSAGYCEEFDYVLCTGVVHHNADPAEPLRKLAMALKRTGVLELMVYNRYHRVLTTAFQKAVRLLGRGGGFDHELEIARRIGAGVQVDGQMAKFIQSLAGRAEADLADALIQPVEYSYTVETLAEVLGQCELELLTPCANQFDKANRMPGWDLQFDNSQLAAEYQALPDIERWKISNHLMAEKSPMLWFYCRRCDSPLARQDDRALCAGFLDSHFVPAATRRKVYYYKNPGSRYELSSRVLDYPGPHPRDDCKRLVDAVARGGPMRLRDLLPKLGIQDTSLASINRLRLCLTTNEFPYLSAVPF